MIVMKVCPKCGRTSDEVEFIGQFCVKCYKPDLEVPTMIKINIGKTTGKLYFKSKWVKNNDSNLKRILSSYIKGDFEDIDYDWNGKVLTIFVKVGKKIVPFKRHVIVRFKPILEPNVAKLHSGYYEGIIQIRGKPSKVKWWVRKISNVLSGYNIGISNTKELKEGIDLYITDKNKVCKVLKMLGLKYLRTKKLYGVKDGRRVYRDTFLVRVGV